LILRPKPQDGGRAAILAVLLALQSLAAVFFVGDVVADLTFEGFDVHLLLESLVSVALIVGVLSGALLMRRTIELARRDQDALKAARGALADLIESRFESWRLTPAERDVALFALKGFDVAGIAEIRGAAPGTVRAQLTRVYAKSQVSSRAELLSLFMDDLLADPLVPNPDPSAAARQG